MDVAERIRSPEVTASIELYPPQDEKGFSRLMREVGRIHEGMEVAFTSVTYGAGGSTRDGTLRVVLALAARYPGRVVAHLTCVGSGEAELAELMGIYKKNEMRNILALRGDLPPGMAPEEATAGGFHYAADLVRWLRKVGGFSSIGVACHPEGHPETPERSEDLEHFVAKVEAGANYAITQFFFENSLYERFREEVLRRGVKVPIVPGILPVRDLDQLLRFAGRCGASVPAWVVSALEPYRGDPKAFKEKSADLAAAQIRELESMGVRHFHIYVLNKSDILLRIADRLDWRKEVPA